MATSFNGDHVIIRDRSWEDDYQKEIMSQSETDRGRMTTSFNGDHVIIRDRSWEDGYQFQWRSCHNQRQIVGGWLPDRDHVTIRDRSWQDDYQFQWRSCHNQRQIVGGWLPVSMEIMSQSETDRGRMATSFNGDHVTIRDRSWEDGYQFQWRSCHNQRQIVGGWLPVSKEIMSVSTQSNLENWCFFF